jgi:eukaryotic-like serine/threonine-protein kinase
MTPDRWTQVSRIFDELLGVEPHARDLRLAALCGQDPELRAEVDSLLHAHERAQSRFLESPAVLSVDVSRTGQNVGDYRLEHEIGRGGMGEVYFATRADGLYVKAVAIKLVRSGPTGSLLLERFRNERQILANLDHPNIARLLDAGVTDDAVPYLAMELVAGIPIDEFCDRHELDVEARLRLFLQVCAAVQYAHRHLVIHRDIKPGNILVTADGTPKLLDFGIAKIVAATPGPAAAQPQAVTLLQAMTPEYASPEQIRGAPISTASDVYSLGVVLYRLLSGHSPFEGRSRSPHELAQAICNEQPLRPSQVSAQRRGRRPPGRDGISDPAAARLARRLRGDLDAILLKALRKGPEERYSSVEQFSDDIQRHLSGLPVAAAKGSWRYRAGKFIDRHRTGVAAGAVLVAIVLAAVVAVVREARVAQQQALIAERQRALAQKRFDDVREFSNSLIFDIHDAIQRLPGATPARQLLLDRAVQYLDGVAADAVGNPDLQRELAWAFQRLAVVQGNPAESNLGDEQASLKSDAKALDLFTAVARLDTATVIDRLNVAMMHRIIAFSTLTEPEGRRHLQTAMAITGPLIAANAANPKVRSERSVEYQDLGLLQDSRGDLASALDSFKEFQRLRLGIRQTNPDYPIVVRSCGMSTSLVGRAQYRLGDSRGAIPTLQEGIGYFESASKDDMGATRELAVARQMLGDMLLSEHDLPGATGAYAQAFAVLGPMAAADPQNALLRLDVAASDFRQGRVLVIEHRYAEAIPLLSRSATVFAAMIPPGRVRDESPNGPGSVYIWLGDAFAGRGDLQQALESYRKSTVGLSLVGSKPLDASLLCELGAGLVKTGNALSRLRNDGEAETAYRKALEILAPVTPDKYRNVPALYVIADAYAGLGDRSAALAERAHDGAERRLLWERSRDAYESSLAAWRRIPEPASLSPAGFAGGDAPTVQRRLDRVLAHLSGAQSH